MAYKRHGGTGNKQSSPSGLGDPNKLSGPQKYGNEDDYGSKVGTPKIKIATTNSTGTKDPNLMGPPKIEYPMPQTREGDPMPGNGTLVQGSGTQMPSQTFDVVDRTKTTIAKG